MFRSERPTIEGKHYRVKDAYNVPAPVRAGGPPIMIGGQGEKKTLRLMAQYADMANLMGGKDVIAHKIEVLAGHCADVGRDIADINKTSLSFVMIAPTTAEAEKVREEFFAARGMSWNDLDDATKASMEPRMVTGDPDTVGEWLGELLDLGLDGIVVNLPANGHDPEVVALAGQVVSKLVS